MSLALERGPTGPVHLTRRAVRSIPGRRCALLIALLAIIAAPGVAQPGLAAPPATRQTDPPDAAAGSPTLEAGLDVSTAYLFRGVSLLGSEPVATPHVRWSWKALSLYASGEEGRIPHDGEPYREADFGAETTFAAGRAAVTLGAVRYAYGRAARLRLAFFDTYEVYGIVTLPGPLAPTFTYFRDVDAVRGAYASAGLGHRFELGERVALAVSMSAGFDFHYNNRAARGGTLNDLLLGADLPVQIDSRWRGHVQIQRTISLRALDDLANDAFSRELYGDRTVVTIGASLAF